MTTQSPRPRKILLVIEIVAWDGSSREPRRIIRLPGLPSEYWIYFCADPKWTSDAFANSLLLRDRRVVRGTEIESVEQSREKARAGGIDLVVYSEIEHWSDRATEWSGIPDRIAIRVRVIDVTSGEVLDDRQLKAASRWATFGGDHPQELLPKLSQQWAASLGPSE